MIPAGATVKYALLWYGGAIFMKPGDNGATGDYTADIGGALDTASDVQGNGITLLRWCDEVRAVRFEHAAGAESVDGGLGDADLAGGLSAALRHLDQRQGIGMGQSHRCHRRIRVSANGSVDHHRQSARASRSERQRRHQQRRQSRGQHQLQLVLGRGGVVAHGHLRAGGRAAEEPGAHGRRLGARLGLPLLPLGQVGAAQGAHRSRAHPSRRQVLRVHAVGRAGGRGAAVEPDVHVRLRRLVHAGALGPVAELVLLVDVRRSAGVRVGPDASRQDATGPGTRRRARSPPASSATTGRCFNRARSTPSSPTCTKGRRRRRPTRRCR